MRKTRLTALLALLLVAAMLFAGCGKKTPEATVTMVLSTGHELTFVMDYKNAPISAQNFVDLSKDGFYDGIAFHRAIEGIVLQGGDPTETGMGGSDQTIKGEFAANGVNNQLSHSKGVISMARSMHYDSASSQFFIMLSDYPGFDGGYAAFGYIDDEASMQALDSLIASLQVDGEALIDPPSILSMRVEEK